MVPYVEETQVNMHWGFSYLDEANSLLTAGAADFGLIGVLVYPLLILFFLRFILEWAQWVMPTLLAVIIALAFMFETLQAEDVPAGYFVQVRNAFAVGLVIWFISRLPRFRLRPAE